MRSWRPRGGGRRSWRLRLYRGRGSEQSHGGKRVVSRGLWPGSMLVRIVLFVRSQGSGEYLLLRLDVVVDRAPELRVPDLVRAVGKSGQETARELVLALRAGLEEFEAS